MTEEFVRADKLLPTCRECRHRTHFLSLCVKSALKVDPDSPACVDVREEGTRMTRGSGRMCPAFEDLRIKVALQEEVVKTRTFELRDAQYTLSGLREELRRAGGGMR